MPNEYIYAYKKAKITYVDDNGDIQTDIVSIESELVCAECKLSACRETTPCYYK